MALRLGRFFGNGPELWLNLQRNYDLRTLEVEMADELAAIPTLPSPERGPLCPPLNLCYGRAGWPSLMVNVALIVDFRKQATDQVSAVLLPRYV